MSLTPWTVLSASITTAGGSAPPQAPVFRQLYSEKRVVAEERRLRVDGSPMGAFQEDFAAVAFANNYSRPVIGWPDDVARLGRREVVSRQIRPVTPHAHERNCSCQSLQGWDWQRRQRTRWYISQITRTYGE